MSICDQYYYFVIHSILTEGCVFFHDQCTTQTACSILLSLKLKGIIRVIWNICKHFDLLLPWLNL